MPKTLKVVLLGLATFFLAVVIYFASAKTLQQQTITWGVNFSQMQAEYLQLNWKKTYLAIINELGAKNIKLHTAWDWVEGTSPRKSAESDAESRGNEIHTYYFKDIDWQVRQAEKKGVSLIYVLGLKTGRWPECHMPGWVQALPEQEQKAQLLAYLSQVVTRYKDSKAIAAWQVENEPLFRFGECPAWYYQDHNFLKAEVNLVKSLDPLHPVIVSDSGEWSAWVRTAGIGDLVGVTLYRSAWFHVAEGLGFRVPYIFLSPATYAKKAALISSLFGKKVICVELQAEPWTSKPILEASLQEQFKSMNPELFQKNIAFAKRTGLDTFYLWGVEWHYWLKEVHNNPELWNEAKKLFMR